MSCVQGVVMEGFVQNPWDEFPWILKDPDAVMDYPLDWSDWLGTDSIADVSVDVPEPVQWIIPTGISFAKATNTTAIAVLWLSGGTAGTNYRVTCRITTADGRVDDRTVEIRVKDR